MLPVPPLLRVPAVSLLPLPLLFPYAILPARPSTCCVTTIQLTNSLQSHYIGALLRQLYKIVGSFDFLGDPVGVLSQVRCESYQVN